MLVGTVTECSPLIGHTDVNCADMVSVDLLVHPEHFIYTHGLYINNNGGINPPAVANQLDWKFQGSASVIKQSSAGVPAALK